MQFRRYYTYEGPVVAFGKVISNKWRGETVASNENQAMSNLGYQFKKDANLTASSRVTLLKKYLKAGDFTS